MPYDNSLDEQIFAKAWESELTKINVSVYSYNQGPKKLQITRENRVGQGGDFRYVKLGRLSKDEIEAILPLIKEAVTSM
jgi:hypothetical protein